MHSIHARAKVGGSGPWTPAPIEAAERKAQFRAIQVAVRVLAGPQYDDLVRELRAAETDADAAGRALTLFDRLPSLMRRKILSVLCSVAWPRPRRTP
jgi:hypothetical protein